MKMLMLILCSATLLAACGANEDLYRGPYTPRQTYYYEGPSYYGYHPMRYDRHYFAYSNRGYARPYYRTYQGARYYR